MIEPVDAMRRIAFLLERTLAETYKVKAFRGAAVTVLATGPTELAERAREGTLRQLPGIGKATEAVVLDVLAGRVPAYLADLEATAGPLATGGEEVRSALRGDLHTHSDWSDGGSPIPDMADTARRLGHDYIVLTDHSPSLTVANGLSAERLERQLDVIAELNAGYAGDGGPPFRILSGIEVNINDDGTLDQKPSLLERLDLVVASLHGKLRMPSEEMTPRMVAAIANPHTDVLGHCTGRLITGGRGNRPESEFDAEVVFAACARFGVAVEVNSRPERLDPPKRLLRLALEAGCDVAVDTDAHAPGQLDWQHLGCERAHLCGVTPDRVVNARPVDALLSWTGRAAPGSGSPPAR